MRLPHIRTFREFCFVGRNNLVCSGT
jgi:hypothetical protein